VNSKLFELLVLCLAVIMTASLVLGVSASVTAEAQPADNFTISSTGAGELQIGKTIEQLRADLDGGDDGLSLSDEIEVVPGQAGFAVNLDGVVYAFGRSWSGSSELCLGSTGKTLPYIRGWRSPGRRLRGRSDND